MALLIVAVVVAVVYAYAAVVLYVGFHRRFSL
jgi:hypothetical protein